MACCHFESLDKLFYAFVGEPVLGEIVADQGLVLTHRSSQTIHSCCSVGDLDIDEPDFHQRLRDTQTSTDGLKSLIFEGVA